MVRADDLRKSSPHGSLDIACDKCHIAASWKTLAEKLDFDHSNTNYPLMGRHSGVSCRSCHTSMQFNKAPSTCSECHIDPHQRQFGAQCAVCHSPESWENRADMDLRHAATRFPLSGVHRSVDCQSCHAQGKYVGTPLECAVCHSAEFRAADSPNHVQANFPANCQICHSLETSGWNDASFAHTQTFPLTNGHNIADCAACHSTGYGNTPAECISCHRTDYNQVSDPDHAGLPFPEECQSCHTTVGWKPAEFDHTLSRFQLAGAHLAVDCASCHSGGQYTGTSQECFGCHETKFRETDNPNHVEGNYDHDCSLCHNVNDWDEATFDHNLSSFALTGAHETTDCNKCHINDQFSGIPEDCFSCHETKYEEVVEPASHIEAKIDHACETCHTTAEWKPSTFDHQATDYSLTGAHLTANCSSCHNTGDFTNLASDCYACHQQNYEDVPEPANHVEAQIDHTCESCHTANEWKPSTFDHQATDYPLTGAHLTANCSSCHSSGEFADLSSECYSCHQADFELTHDPNHVEENFSHKCQMCHSSVAWSPANFDHSLTDYPLTGAHKFASCESCHVGNRFAGTPQQCRLCHLPDFDNAADPTHVESGFSQDCEACHKTSKWSDATYDHALSRFPLTGAHLSAACKSCHTDGRFTGTNQQCYPCHESAYENAAQPNHAIPQIDRACESCHTTFGWKPSTFDHNATNYALTGGHRRADCAGCHVQGQFAGTSKECSICHISDFEKTNKPNHTEGRFTNDCTVCHTINGWKPSTAHGVISDYLLTGAHRSTDCIACHADGTFTGTPNRCISCHLGDFEGAEDPNHQEGQFNRNCLTCHATDAWSPATFDHDRTNFQLTGGHTTTDCAACHINGQFNGTPTECYPCHEAAFNEVEDPNHQLGEFDHDCLPCHTTEVWIPSTFDHSNTDYPLTGAHLEATCSSCHIDNRYADLPQECYPCHEQDFTEVQDPNHVQGNFDQTCETCHTTGAWSPAEFDHSQSDFPLTGAHIEVSCEGCHANGRYSNTPIACYPCHQDDFADADEPNHQQLQFDQNCTICHSTEAWQPANFDHDETGFPLTGAHIEVGCASCHENGQYAGTPDDCYTCHTADYNNVGNPDHATPRFPRDCEMCHTDENWNSNYNHIDYFPINAGDHRQGRDWNLCSECHNNANDYAVFTCIDCHEHSDRRDVDDEHREVRNYRYTSEGCYDCHPDGRAEDIIRPIITIPGSEKNFR